MFSKYTPRNLWLHGIMHPQPGHRVDYYERICATEPNSLGFTKNVTIELLPSCHFLSEILSLGLKLSILLKIGSHFVCAIMILRSCNLNELIQLITAPAFLILVDHFKLFCFFLTLLPPSYMYHNYHSNLSKKKGKT